MKLYPSRCPTHRGELLREDVIPGAGESMTELPRMLGISTLRYDQTKTCSPQGRCAPCQTVRE